MKPTLVLLFLPLLACVPTQDAARPTAETPASPASNQPTAQVDDGATRLSIVSGEGSGDSIVVPDSGEMTIGRSSKSDIVISEGAVSRNHATLRRVGDRYVLRDLESVNGTLVNGEPIDEIELSGGDTIKIGETVLLVSLP